MEMLLSNIPVPFNVRLISAELKSPYSIWNNLTFSPSLVVRLPRFCAARCSNYYPPERNSFGQVTSADFSNPLFTIGDLPG